MEGGAGISEGGVTRATLAVILARGMGSRLRADDGAVLTAEQESAAAAGAKGLMPVAGRPFLDFLLHELAEAGVTDIVFVVSPDDTLIRQRYDTDAPPSRLRLRYAVQQEPRGTAHALLAARDAVCAALGAPADDAHRRHFLMCNADDLYPSASVRALVELGGPGLIAFDAEALLAGGTMEPARIRAFALLDIGEDGALQEIVEKPAEDHPLALADTRWVSMNLWRFTDAIFDDCAAVRPSARGELELADAVRYAIDRGERFMTVPQHVAVPGLTHRRDVAALDRLLAGWVPRP
jgi:glucose-1-phosphate thymidylyltransferase